MRAAKIPPDLRLKDIPCISDSPLSINPLRTNVFLLKRAQREEKTEGTDSIPSTSLKCACTGFLL